MWVKIKKRMFGGLSFIFGIVVVFGLYFLVQAVAPGAIDNPFFGPFEDDVDIQLGLQDCVRMEGVGTTLPCPVGYSLTGGGFDCNIGNSRDYRLEPNVAAGTYTGQCAGFNVDVFAVCCR